MGIRAIWVAVPVCTAAGVVTFSVVAAQDAAPPAGYYVPRFKAHPTVIAEQNKPIRPFGDSQPANPLQAEPQPNGNLGALVPARMASNPHGTVQTAAPKSKIGTKPVAAEPTTADFSTRPKFFPNASAASGQAPPPMNSMIRPVAAVEPELPAIPAPTLTPPGFLPAAAPLPNPTLPPSPGPRSMALPAPVLDVQIPEIPKLLPPGGLPELTKLPDGPKQVIISTLAPVSTPAPVNTPAPVSTPAPANTPAPAFTPTPSMAPPRITLEVSEPVKPLPAPVMAPAPVTNLVPAPLPGPTPAPAFTPMPAPTATPAPVATLPPLKNTPPVAPANPSLLSAFTGTPLPTRQAPMVVLETICPESVGIGQTLSYELVVRNTGANSVGNVRVEEELPAGTTFVQAEPVAEQSGNRLGWVVGTLEGGTEKRIRIQVKPSEEGELRSRAVVSFATATETRVKVTRPKINLVMTADDNVRVGDEVAFKIQLSNTGTGAAQKMLIQAKLSEGLQHPQGQIIEAELPALAPGETKTVTLRANAVKAGSHSCLLAASADGNPAESVRRSLAVVEPLLQTKLVGPVKCLVRAEPTYTLELSNPGSAATDPIQAWAVVPEGMEFVSASDQGIYTAANRTIVWKLNTLPQNTTKPVSFKLRASSMFEGSIRTVAQSMRATVPTEGVVRAGTLAKVLESKADTTIRAEGMPALRFEVIDVEDPVEVGKEALYEVKVTNTGTAPCTNVQLVASLAEGTTLASANGPTSSRNQGPLVTFDPIAQLNTKGEAIFQVRVKGTVPGDQKLRIQLVCDQIRTPIVKEENTRFYRE
ncbi:MAG: hypothetical protein ACRCZF_13605 [Gemmataceae bacterium]